MIADVPFMGIALLILILFWLFLLFCYNIKTQKEMRILLLAYLAK